MAVNVAINGFGRIGRLVFRALVEQGLVGNDINVVAVGDIVPADNLAYLLKYDSTQGRFAGTVSSTKSSPDKAEDDVLIVNGAEIRVVSAKTPAELPWKALGVDIVIESTGLFTEADKAKGKAASDKLLGDFLKQAGSIEGFRRQVQAMGMTPEAFTEQFTDRAIVEEVVNREVRATIPITPEQVQKFYDENPKRFEQPETVRAAHILLTTVELASKQELAPDKQKAQRALIEALLKRVRAGEDFGKLAKEFSQDPGSKERGGEYVFPRGQMAVEFETAAFSMSVGQISDVVTTKFGYHIIKVLERNAAGKIEFAKVKERVRENLQQEEADKRLPAYLEAVKKEAGVEILDAKYK